MNPLLERISLDPKICGGRACIKGTRVWVTVILDLLADGVAIQEILSDYPQLRREDVLAAIAYGSEMSRSRIVEIPA